MEITYRGPILESLMLLRASAIKGTKTSGYVFYSSEQLINTTLNYIGEATKLGYEVVNLYPSKLVDK